MTDPLSTDRLREIVEGLALAPDDAWLIRKNGYFYRPNRSGYTTSKAQAGRYTEYEARVEHLSDPRNISGLPASEWPDKPYVMEPSELRPICELALEALALRSSPNREEKLVEALRQARLDIDSISDAGNVNADAALERIDAALALQGTKP